MRVSCLGPVGSFSERAAQVMCPDAERVLAASFARAAELLAAGEVDCAVLPVENALNGGVREVMDLLAEEDIFGVEECALPVDHRLALLEGTRAEDVRFIYSHEQAIGQCSAFLRAQFPEAQFVFTASTAESLTRLDAQSAGIVGAHVKRDGVRLSEANIADNKGNFTRFMRFVRAEKLPSSSKSVFLSAVCPHRPGALLGLLEIFSRFSLNLTRIESRPVRGSFGEYRFFIEFAGDLADGRVQGALEEIERYCRHFKLLAAF